MRVLFVGNSITLHAVSDEKDWRHESGMAASDINSDYVHLFGKAANLSDMAYARNFYPFETNSSQADRLIASLKPALDRRPEIVVVQLGDNIRKYRLDHLYAFSSTYPRLLAAVKDAKLFCLSTFWSHDMTDSVIKSACDQAGGTYVYIGDIYDDPRNPDRRKIDFSNPGVDKHPKGWGMRQIASRLIDAARRTGALRKIPTSRPDVSRQVFSNPTSATAG